MSMQNEVKNGISSYCEKELTEPMETTSPSVDLWSLGQRKAEISDPEEEDSSDSESEDDDDSSEEEEEENSDSEPEWDKDSFDGREYHSDEKELSDKEADLKWRRYERQLIETKPENIPPCLYSGIAPLTDLEGPSVDGLTTREFCTDLATACLDKLNQQQGSNVKFEDVLWVNFRGGSRPVYFITFVAKEFEALDAPLLEYQAKVLHTFLRETYPILCRPSLNPTWVREKLKELTKAKKNEAGDKD